MLPPLPVMLLLLKPCRPAVAGFTWATPRRIWLGEIAAIFFFVGVFRFVLVLLMLIAASH